jgi:hypothetical protein
VNVFLNAFLVFTDFQQLPPYFAFDVNQHLMWMGDNGVITALHQDGNEVFLSVLTGRKSITLVSPTRFMEFYPMTANPRKWYYTKVLLVTFH